MQQAADGAALTGTSATEQCTELTKADAVEPIRPCTACRSPVEPTQTMPADREAASRAAIGGSGAISASILTGLHVVSMAPHASRIAASAAGLFSNELIAYT